MDPKQWQVSKELLDEAVDLPAHDRAAFLDANCPDPEVRAYVEQVLIARERPTTFLSEGAIAEAAHFMMADSQRALQGEMFGSYSIKHLIGSGGMGEVYLATDTELQRDVALKVLLRDAAIDKQRLQRFLREARAAAALNHPNIAHIYKVGEEGGHHYIAMELVTGTTLRGKMRDEPASYNELLGWLSQVADALAKAHQAGVVHRDLKPENIMISGDGYAKVLDFGLAKVLTDGVDRAPTLTRSGMVMGTVNYMSPEQARGLDVDARTDIWSLGVMIYEAVSGELPFKGVTAIDTMMSIIEREPLPLTDADLALQGVVSRCLAKDRDQRYSSATELAADLRAARRRGPALAELPKRETGLYTIADSRAAQDRGALPGTLLRDRVWKKYLIGAGVLLTVVLGIAGYTYYVRSPATHIRSIAVLPFANQNSDPNTEYLADGIPESISNTLSQLSELKVMSRNSVSHYKVSDSDPRSVARELNVGAILCGRVTQRGPDLSVSVELINAQDNSKIWGQQYNRKLTDVFTMQEEIAKEISEKLQLKLYGDRKLAKRPTENIKAFQYYSQGREAYARRTRDDLLTTISYYERAIAEDSNYALAYAGLADAYGALGVRGYIPPKEGRRREEEYARLAIELDGNLAEAHASMGLPNIVFAPCDFALGDSELRRAIELSPSLAAAHQYLGHSLAAQGRFDESLAEYTRARELDPLSPIIARNVASAYNSKGDYSKALDLLRQANELGPPFTNPVEIDIYIKNGRLDEALAELGEARQTRPDDPLLIFDLGAVYAAQRRRADALQVIRQLEEMSGANYAHAQFIARIYAGLEDKEKTFQWLERGLGTGAIGPINRGDTVWDLIKDDPRSPDLLHRMGIPFS